MEVSRVNIKVEPCSIFCVYAQHLIQNLKEEAMIEKKKEIKKKTPIHLR